MMRFLPLLLSFVAACGNSVDPFGEGGPPFAVFGYLDTERDTQTVRVEPVRPLVPFDTALFSVTLRDETAGASEELHADVVRSDDGSPVFLYRATLPVALGHTYTLRAASPGAGTTTARATVPPLRQAGIGIVSGDTVLFLSASANAPERTTLVYRVAVADDSVEVPITYAVGNNLGDAYFYRLQFRRDRNVLLNTLGLASGAEIALVDVTAHVVENGPEWTGRTSHNIENGFGFFSTTSRSVLDVTFPDSVRLRIERGP